MIPGDYSKMNKNRQENEINITHFRKVTDIYQYPFKNQIATYSNDQVVTLGDLHGNAAKFLNLLVREGLIEITKKDYDELVEIYQQSDQAIYNFNSFKIILKNILIKKPCPKLRLIGDDLADRGKNDLLTLYIFKRLRELNINIEVIVSNHGVEFLKQYGYGIAEPIQILYQGTNQIFGNSIYGLRKDIRNHVIKIEEVENLIQQYYLPNLKVLSYTINNTNQITIYSHAPITAIKIKLLTDIFNVKFLNATVNDLANTINLINNIFKKIISNKVNLKIFLNETIRIESKNFHIFNDFINDRYEEIQIDHITKGEYSYKVINVHGHVGEKELILTSSPQWSYINLDTNLGKAEDLNKHEYIALVSKENFKEKTYPE